MVSVRASVDAVLDGDTSWRAETARALADQVDESGSASAARELRSVMEAIEAGTPVEAGDAVDQLAAARAARRRASSPVDSAGASK